MSESIFSTYKTGENRVTGSILAVLKSLSLARTERLLGALMEESGFELVRFQNQPSKGAPGIPDAKISSSFQILLETKLDRNAVREEQLRRHLKRLDKATEDGRWLVVLTPDSTRPRIIDNLDDERLIWSSFTDLTQAIDELLADGNEVVSEREAFLLRELQSMLSAEGLVGSERNVVVVPARRAWPAYNRLSAYICQPSRPFQSVQYVAFYSKGEIQPPVPEILEVHDQAVWERGRHDGLLADLVDRVLDQEPVREGDTNKVFILTPPDDPRTKRINQPVANDLKSDRGVTIAFTQNQRYVALDDLLKATHTSDLVGTP